MQNCQKCGRLLISISWSGLLTYSDCPAKVKLRRKHKNPARNLRNYTHGNIADRVMRQWLLNNPESHPHSMADMVDKATESIEKEAKEAEDGVIKWRYKSDRDEVITYCKELVRRLEPILTELVLPYEYQPAYRFRIPISVPKLGGEPEQISLIGEMDLLTRDTDGNFSIWDLKGTKDDSYWRKTWPQLVFYDLAVGAGFEGAKAKETGLIQPMCKEQVLRFTITDADRAALMVKIINMADAYWQDEFPTRKDSAGCYNCEVIHACPRWNPVGSLVSRKLTLDEMVSTEQRLLTIGNTLPVVSLSDGHRIARNADTVYP